MDWDLLHNTKLIYDEYMEELKKLDLKFEPFPLDDELPIYEIERDLIFSKYKQEIINAFEHDHQAILDSEILTVLWSDFESFKDYYFTFQGIFYNRYPDAEEIDYLKNKYHPLCEKNPLEKFISDTERFHKLHFSNKKKRAFLEERANQLGYQLVYVSKTEKLIVTKFENKLQKDENAHQNIAEIDFEINSKLSDKIILLHELGLIKHLRSQTPFLESTNALAKCLAKLTGEKQTSIQSCLNPIINPDSSQKNNPLKNIRNTDKVRNFLIELGYKPSEKD